MTIFFYQSEQYHLLELPFSNVLSSTKKEEFIEMINY